MSALLSIALVYLFVYPLVTSIAWMVTAVGLFYLRRERPAMGDGLPLPSDDHPLVSVLIPCHNEESVLERTLEQVLNLTYVNKEIIVVDDGSTDATREIAERYARAGKVRLLAKMPAEGKPMALNDALPLARGEIIFAIDADSYPVLDILEHIVKHFASSRVGAVTGNPRVGNRGSLWARIQVVEFPSILCLMRRAQRVWGRVLSVSGVVGAYRKSALVNAGLWDPDILTEDINISWALQKRAWDIRYEPRAVVWMEVPESLGHLWRQRVRWAQGLQEVLWRHRDVLSKWRMRRLWPVIGEAVGSILWAYDFTLTAAAYAILALLGRAPAHAQPLPPLWGGMLLAMFCLSQLAVGLGLEARYDPSMRRYFFYAIFYPAFYWILMALSVPAGTLAILRRKIGPRRHARWRTQRYAR